MAKKFFRFLRGELNGYYLQKLNNSANELTKEDALFLGTFKSMVFKNAADLKKGETALPADVLIGIGTIAGVFPPYVPQDAFLGAIRFSLSHIVQNEEVSDEGLYSFDSESFNFPITFDRDLYKSEAVGRNAYATAKLKSSMIEKGAKLLGFFQEGDKVIADDGSIDLQYLIKPPADFTGDWYEWAEEHFTQEKKSYSPYYGNKYLYLAEKSPVIAKTGNESYLEVIKAMQYVRYNGVSIKSLCEFARILCPDYLFITEINWTAGQNYGIVNYGIDENYVVNDKLLRTEIFKLMTKTKFKQYIFNEVSITVTRDDNGKVIDIVAGIA